MEDNWLQNTISRYPVQNKSSFDVDLWQNETLLFIQECVYEKLKSNPNYFKDPLQNPEERIRPLIIPLEQIKNVADSISQSNPHTGTKERIQMIISYIVSYVENEETVNQKPKYDSSVTKYDGEFGIQRMSNGQIPIRKKGLNQIGRMF
jgi:hypothetical protein